MAGADCPPDPPPLAQATNAKLVVARLSACSKRDETSVGDTHNPLAGWHWQANPDGRPPGER